MEYHFKPVAKTCTATGQELAPGSVCYSSLVERNGQFVRLDFCAEGWSGPQEGELGHWRTVVPIIAENKTQPLDADALMHHFERLAEDANPAQENLLYVIALLLLQKRRFKLAGSRRAGNVEYLELTGVHGEGPYEVRDQRLSKNEIEQLQRELKAHLTSAADERMA
jgi:hypothetical protein